MASRISQLVSQLLPPPFRNSKHLAASASTASSSSPTSSPTTSSKSPPTTTTAMPERPPFDALPLRKDGPHGNAWGLFGDSDELGMLNLLTAENTAAAAASEIRDGTRVPLDWPLNRMPKPCFGRRVASHVIKEEAPKYTVNDDELTINTQSSTQWDGYRHFGYQKEKLFFNGRTQEDLRASTVNGTQAWVEHGGIVGRGVLIDYASWADAHSIPITPFQTTPIPISTLKQVAADQNLTFQRGDILLVRYGFTRAYDALTHDEALATGKDHPTTIGVESSEETLRWLWDEGFAAVVGDTLTFEAWPCQDWKFWLHEWLLAGWGMPIGELFDLERLSEECKRRKRWSFFFSSMPLKVPGGVASPPCGMAIF